MTDEEILERLRAGDPSACTACVEAHADGLYRLAYRLLRDGPAAEDVVQETFLNAWKGLDRFDGRARLGTWLFRIAYNAALMKLRTARPVEALEDEYQHESEAPAGAQHVAAWTATPEEEVAQSELQEVMDHAIDALPASLRAAFVLRDVEERTTAETAEILGLTQAAVKVRLYRARLALRERLAGYFAENRPSEPGSMTCEELEDYLYAYIDGELDEPLSEAAAAHLATCKRCHILLDTTRQTITLCRAREKRVVPASGARLYRQLERGFSRRGGVTFLPPPHLTTLIEHDE